MDAQLPVPAPIPLPEQCFDVQFHPSSNVLAASCVDGTIHAYVTVSMFELMRTCTYICNAIPHRFRVDASKEHNEALYSVKYQSSSARCMQFSHDGTGMPYVQLHSCDCAIT